MSQNRAIQLYDPQTGRTILVYPQQSSGPPAPVNPPPQPYPMEPYAQQPYPVQPYQRPRRRRRQSNSRAFASRGLLAGGVFAAFIASWIPCAFDAPGGTLLCWGLTVAYLIYRAVRGS